MHTSGYDIARLLFSFIHADGELLVVGDTRYYTTEYCRFTSFPAGGEVDVSSSQ